LETGDEETGGTTSEHNRGTAIVDATTATFW
jgi:hypothetical protein